MQTNSTGARARRILRLILLSPKSTGPWQGAESFLQNLTAWDAKLPQQGRPTFGYLMVGSGADTSKLVLQDEAPEASNSTSSNRAGAGTIPR